MVNFEWLTPLGINHMIDFSKFINKRYYFT